MKKQGLFILLLLLAISCSKDTENKLEGKWQLRQVETEGTVVSVDTVWYNFQNTLFSYQLYNPSTGSYRQQYGFNTVTGGELLLELGDNPLPNDQFLPLTDWDRAERSFSVTKLKGSELILTDASGKIYTFRRF